MLLIVSIINTAELYSTFKYHMKIGETTRCCSFFLRTHVKISSKISIIEFNIQIKWCIIVTPSREAEKDYQGYFNSPPNKKNHIATTMINTVLFKISTHIFTKRMTAFRLSLLSPTIFQLTSSRRGWPSYKISFECHFHFNSHPHEEDDLTNEIKILSSIYFNSHPHEEDDTTSEIIKLVGCDISTHILTKRMTIFVCIVSPALKVFQLTSSRRGWHSFVRSSPFYLHFNSHPHEEDDHIRMYRLASA